MVCFHSSISVDNPIDMAKSLTSTDPCMKLKQTNQLHKARKSSNSANQLNIPACEQYQSAVIDLIILIAVVSASGFLLYPYLKLLLFKVVEIFGAIADVFKEEVSSAPMIYWSLGTSIFCAFLSVLTIMICTSKKCGKPGCRGLHKAAEFDIQLETEERVKNSSSNSMAKDGLKMGLFELPRDYHRELESELKKMAPINGRAVLVFRARCGCSVGRMEVPGPKKPRKIKK